MISKTPGPGQISASGLYRWRFARVADRTFLRLKLARRRQIRSVVPNPDGQALAGTGALVFEGELLELPRKSWH